jgi:hypothetical protein
MCVSYLSRTKIFPKQEFNDNMLHLLFSAITIKTHVRYPIYTENKIFRF